MTCQKCGHVVVDPLWHPEDLHEKAPRNHNCPARSVTYPIAEHLHYFCRCGFDWTTRTREDVLLDRVNAQVKILNEVEA